MPGLMCLSAELQHVKYHTCYEESCLGMALIRFQNEKYECVVQNGYA